MPIPPRLATALVTVALGVLPACSDDSPRSQTPQLDVAAPENDALFLTADDVSVFPGFDGAEVRDTSDVPLFENPDPRGPCGAPVSPPQLEEVGARAISGATIGLVQLIAPTAAEHEAYVAELRADLLAVCEPYESVTNTGTTQRVSEITGFDVDGEGVVGAAWTNLVEVEERAIHVGVMVLETAGHTAFIQVSSQTAIPQEGMQHLAEAAVLRLQSQP